MKPYIFLTTLCHLLLFETLFCHENTLDDYYNVAKEHCENITQIRIEIDRINNEILQLLTERTAYVKRAGDLKAFTTKIATDQKRVDEQRKKLVEISHALKLPTEISLPTFQALVDASIQYEQEYIDQLSSE